MKRFSFCVVIGLILVFLAKSFGYACECARPLAMGGAFTGLADDANATYWNPAALGLMDKTEATYTGTVYDRDAINYDDWVAMAMPLRAFGLNENINWGTMGLSFMNNIDKTKYSEVYYGLDYSALAEETDRWYMLSYGRKITDRIEGLCVGGNIRYCTLDYKIKESLTVGSTTYTADSSDSDEWASVDLAVYYIRGNLSAGILFQNANEPQFTLFGKKYIYRLNVRPGVAYRFGEKFILSGEVYDATDQSDYMNLRLGAEAKVTDNVYVRLGAYDFTDTEKAGCAFTGGFGIASGELFKNVKTELNYGAMYWYDSKTDTKDKFTHFLSVSTKF